MNTRRSILAVDDTPESLALLVRLLTAAGYEVRPADSGELALAAVAAKPPDVILLDVQMPGMDGLEVCRRLQAREETRQIPIILISAFADAEDWVAGLRLGAADYISKPFRTEELLSRVATHLGLGEARVALERQTEALSRTNDRLQAELIERQRVEDELRLSLERAERSRRAMLSTLEDQKSIEVALRASEKRLGDITSSMGDWVWEMDATATFRYASSKVKEILGDVVGKTPFDFMPPEEARRVAAHFAEIAARKEPFKDLESWSIGRKGERVCFLTSGVPILDDRGNLKGYRGVSKDITERKRTEQEIRLQSAALNAAADAILITNRDGAIEWFNPAFSALTGYSAEEALGRNLRDLLKSGAQDPGVYRQLWEAILGGEVWRGEMTNRRKDGSHYPEEQTITPVKDAAGAVAHFIAIKRDLTEEKRLQVQFLQAQKMESVGRLAGGIAHDFNNLLTVINGTAEIASVQLREADPLRQDLAEIRQAGERAALLTRQLLAFSRKQIMAVEVLSLGRLVTDMEGMLRRLIGENIDLVVAPAKGADHVRADRGQLEQVVLNLVVNARDAMPGGGSLTIETRAVELDATYTRRHPLAQVGPHVMLSVSDTGVGMDEATRAQMFEPFFTTKELGQGTGLGLSTVDGIVKQSAGSIEVYSEPGRGTSFKIYLPRVGEVEVAAQAQAARPVTETPASETVFVVEDEKALRELAKRILKSAGYTVLTFGTAEEALPALTGHEGPVHLLLTDLILPGMTGRELATQLAEIRPEIKVLYTSGYTDDAIMRHGVLENVSHFLGKPYSVAELKGKVRAVLDL